MFIIRLTKLENNILLLQIREEFKGKVSKDQLKENLDKTMGLNSFNLTELGEFEEFEGLSECLSSLCGFTSLLVPASEIFEHSDFNTALNKIMEMVWYAGVDEDMFYDILLKYGKITLIPLEFFIKFGLNE